MFPKMLPRFFFAPEDAGAAAPPKDGDFRVDVTKLGGNEHDVAEALTGLVGSMLGEPEEIPQEDGSPSEEPGEQETAPTEDTEDGQSEQQETAAIEPPVSWSAEGKELFAKLPPEMQKQVAERESERERFIATHGQKTAEETQRLQAKHNQLETERAQQADLFNATILQLVPELQAFQSMDWSKLASEKPAEYVQKWQQFNDLNSRLNTAQGHLANIRNQQSAEQKRQHGEYLEQQMQMLTKALPDIADAGKRTAILGDLTKHLPEFKPEEITGIADHRHFLVARDAMLWRKAEAARKSAQEKRVTPAQSNVRPLRPAARQEGQGDAAEQNRVKALHGKLAKSGDIRDAADIMVAAGLFGKP